MRPLALTFACPSSGAIARQRLACGLIAAACLVRETGVSHRRYHLDIVPLPAAHPSPLRIRRAFFFATTALPSLPLEHLRAVAHTTMPTNRDTRRAVQRIRARRLAPHAVSFTTGQTHMLQAL